MSGSIEVITFTENCNQMECMGGMRLQSWFLIDGHFCLPEQCWVPQLVYLHRDVCVCV